MGKYLVLGMSQWKISNKETGEVERQGGSIHLMKNKPARSEDERKSGFIPLEAKVPPKLIGVFDKLPGLYDIELDMESRKVKGFDGGTMTVIEAVIEEARFLSLVDIKPSHDTGKPSDVSIAKI